MTLNKLTSDALADNTIDNDSIANNSIPIEKLSNVNLAIAPEVLTIDVAAPAAGQDTQWLWNWLTSSLPYARRAITNSNELNVPLYKQGTYTVNNFAKTQYGSMTQAHTMYFKWIEGAGTQNNISWVTDQGTFTDSHPDINGGSDTTVQRLSISVPSTVTPPTLTAPSVTYGVSFVNAGAYRFSGPRDGDNPNIGPLRRGGTYTFNVNASGHPFYLTTDNGTNFAAGTYFGEYTSGVTGSRNDSGTVTFVVPANAPDTLYYQCGNHSSMRGAITIKDLAVETNINGNYVVYAQHTQEGHKTPVELRPIPSLVNQMCIVYDATTGQFVPQDLATYVENTPSFENKIREVAGTAELVVEDGSAVVAKVNVYADSTYLPLTDNNAGDQAFATDTNKLYIWDGSAWQLAGAANTGELSEGTNLYFTNARADARAQLKIDALVDSSPGTLDTLNELAAALGDDANFSTTVTNSIATKLPLAGGTLTGPLTVQGNGNATVQWGDTTAIGALSFDTNDNPLIRSYTGKDLFFQTNGGNNRMVILSGGNVGIGTTNPQQLLHLESNSSGETRIQFKSDNLGGSHGIFWVDENAINQSQFYYNHSSNKQFLELNGNGLQIYSKQASSAIAEFGSGAGGYNNFSIPNGNVGIGTSSPLRKIHISDAGDTHLVLQSTNATNDYEIFEMGVGANSNSKVDLTFRTRNNSVTGGSEVMRLSNDGDVHLNSGVDVRIQLGTSGTGATSVSDNSVYVRGNDDDLILGAAGNGNIFFKENAATHMTIESGGNVGIGITNPENALHVSSSANAQILVQNSSTGDASIKFNRSGQTFFMGIESSDNSFRISDTGTGVGDGDRFIIDASGNVGIGTTNPDNNQHGSIDPNLHVYGGTSNSGYALVARLEAGNDSNERGASLLINHTNDRGLLIEAGRDGRDYPNPPYFNGTGNPSSSGASISDDDGVAHLGILNSGGTNTRMLTLRQHSWIGDNKYNVGINQQYPVTKLEISDYKDGTGNNPNGIGLRLSSTSPNTGSNSANGGTGIEFAGHGHNYNGAGTSVAGSNPIAIRINPVYEYWGQNNSMSNYGQTYPYLKFDFKKSDNVNYITPLLVSGLGNGRVAIGNDTANVSHRLSLGSDAKSFNYRVSGSGGHAIADGSYEENARSFSLGGSDTAFITEGTVSNSNKWRVKFEGDFGNNYQGGGLNFPAAQIYVTNTQPTVYIGSTNITVSRDSGTGKLKVTNQSNSYAVHFTGKITVWDHPQSNRPTFDSEMQAISLQGTDDYGTNLYGGLIMKTPAYSEYHFQWSGTQSHSLTFTCGSYQSSTMEYTSHQTNGGSDIHKYVFGKWANNHSTHTWNEMENNGSTWGLTTTFTATDISGGSSNPDGKLVINETYGGGSVSTRTLVVRTHFGSWGLTFA